MRLDLKKLSIKQIKEQLKSGFEDNPDFLCLLTKDARKGVSQLGTSGLKRLAKQNKQKQAFFERFRYERELWEKGVSYIAGVDEVGRGPLAGPVVAGAVILPKDFSLIGVNDSKKLSDQKRRKLLPEIKEACLSYSIGEASSQLIDEINIYQATKVAMKRAVLGLAIKPEALLVDAMTIPIAIPQQKIIKGDGKSNSIGSASIIAKEYRDDLMIKMAAAYPGYDFAENVGYGTKKHLTGLKAKGPCPIHRKTFAPVKKFS